MSIKTCFSVLLLTMAIVIAPGMNIAMAVFEDIPVPPTVDIYESFDFQTMEGIYDIHVDGGYVDAFAVGNDTAQAAFTSRTGWSASITDSSSWDATLSKYGLSAGDLTFEDIFGTGVSTAAFYWDIAPTNPIGSTESDNSFTWSAQSPASNFIAFTDVGPVTGTVVVPEPISSTLFIIGGATLGFRRFRKRIS